MAKAKAKAKAGKKKAVAAKTTPVTKSRRTADKVNTWMELQERLMREQDETNALQWLQAERSGQNRRTWVLRIYSRYNRLRTHRERAEFTEGSS